MGACALLLTLVRFPRNAASRAHNRLRAQAEAIVRLTRVSSRAHAPWIVGWLSCLLLLAPADPTFAQSRAVKRVLVLRQTTLSNQGNARFDATFADTLRTSEAFPVEVSTETVETVRFPRAAQSFIAYLSDKYADRKVDVIVVVGMEALNFARANRVMFGSPPIVATVSQASELDAGSGITGLRAGPAVSLDGMIDLALALRPETCCVFVVDGARNNGGAVEAEFKQRWNGRNRGASLTYLRGLPLSDLLVRLSAIPDQSIVLLTRQPMQTSSEDVDQFDALAQIAAASRAPVLSPIEDLVGRGIVGGYVFSFEANARLMADMTSRILQGASAAEIPVGRAVYGNVLDWRQLQRWNIPETRVPAGTVVLFRQQSFVSLYRPYALAGVVVFLAQLALIVGLFVQRRRRRRAEEESRSHAERYRSVVDTQSELICRFLPDTTLTFVNDAYCRFWNKTRDEIIGRKFLELIPPSARQSVLGSIERRNGGVQSHEHPVTLADGGIGWQHWVNHAILDAHGRVVELQGVGRDITDRKLAENALIDSEASKSAILRAIPDLMFVLRRDGTYVDFHSRDIQLLYAPPDGFLGKRIQDVLPPVLAATFMDALERAYATDEPVVVEYELTIGDELRYYEARLVRAGQGRILSIVRDLTDARRAVELNRNLAGRIIAEQEVERQRIARELHDDLSQKIALLNIEIDRVATGVQEAGLKRRLHNISMHTGEIASAIHNLSHELHPSKLQTLGLRAAIQALCRDVSQQSRVVVRFSDRELPPSVDPNVSLCLYRITQEALHNVARHSRALEAEVRLFGGNGSLSLEIEDSGVGFDAKLAQGTGLGLVSMRERVAFLQGQLVIHAAPFAGTRISVHVPLSAPAHHSSTSLPARGQITASGAGTA